MNSELDKKLTPSPVVFRVVLILILIAALISALGFWDWAGVSIRGLSISRALADQFTYVNFYYHLIPFLIFAATAWFLRKENKWFVYLGIILGLAVVVFSSYKAAVGVSNAFLNKKWTAVALTDAFSNIYQIGVALVSAVASFVVSLIANKKIKSEFSTPAHPAKPEKSPRT